MRPKKLGSTTTELPYVTFETTQIYLPDDFTTANFEYVEHTVDETMSTETDDHQTNQRQTRYTDFNPYAWNSGDGDDLHVPLGSASTAGGNKHNNLKWERRKLRKNTGRRRLDRHNNQPHKQQKREIRNANFHDIYYIQSANIVSQLHDNLPLLHHTNRTFNIFKQNNTNDSIQQPHQQHQHHTIAFNQHDFNPNASNTIQQPKATNKKKFKPKKKATDAKTTKTKITFKLKNGKLINKIALQRTQSTDNRRQFVKELIGNESQTSSATMTEKMTTADGLSTNEHNNNNNQELMLAKQIKTKQQQQQQKNATGEDNDKNNVNDDMSTDEAQHFGDATMNDSNSTMHTDTTSNQLHRVKRKSGKAAGALSRPKGGSDSGSKSTSRKKDGKWLSNASCWSMCTL